MPAEAIRLREHLLTIEPLYTVNPFAEEGLARLFVTHPLSGARIPVWVGNYVLMTYGEGAVMGVPIPLLGSLIGAVVGAFAGALLAELTHSRGVSAATRVATGALLGRIVAVAVKAGIGCAILVWVAFALWLGR